MKSVEMPNQQSRNTPFFLLIISFVFSYYYIDLGFAFKPYMILSIVFLLLSLKSFVVHKLRVFEVALLTFFMYYCLTGFFAKYPDYSLRLIMGILLILFCYFVIRYIVSIASIEGIEKSIAAGGLIFNGLSLILYAIGLASLGFAFDSNGIKEFGVVTDRGFPRLIGLAEDPNVFSFYNLIFFFYYLTHFDKKWSKIGLLLSGSTIILSLSRGGIGAIIIGLLLMFISSSVRQKVKMIFILPLFFYLTNLILKLTVNIDVFAMIAQRFSADDGGSGRSRLWESGLQFFYDSPVFGIGIFNYLPYSVSKFGYPAHMHNTFLDTLVEGGVVGFVLYSLVFIILIITYFNNRKRIKDKGYLLFTLVSMIFLMNTYSLMVNESFYLVLALMWRYLYAIKVPDPVAENELNPKKIKRRFKRYRIVWSK